MHMRRDKPSQFLYQMRFPAPQRHRMDLPQVRDSRYFEVLRQLRMPETGCTCSRYFRAFRCSFGSGSRAAGKARCTSAVCSAPCSAAPPDAASTGKARCTSAVWSGSRAAAPPDGAASGRTAAVWSGSRASAVWSDPCSAAPPDAAGGTYAASAVWSGSRAAAPLDAAAGSRTSAACSFRPEADTRHARFVNQIDKARLISISTLFRKIEQGLKSRCCKGLKYRSSCTDVPLSGTSEIGIFAVLVVHLPECTRGWYQ